MTANSAEDRPETETAPAAFPTSGAFPVSDAARKLLDLFPSNRAGICGNFFHVAARAGVTSPAEVVAHVLRDVAADLTSPRLTPGREAVCFALLAAIGAEPDGARSYAASVIAWNGLPASERQKRKAALAQTYQAQRMAEMEPTAKQLDFLRTLGDEGPPPGNRAEASQRIEELKSRRARMPFNQAVREKAGLTGNGGGR